MEKILYEVGLQDFISICQQKSISIKTFEYIMSPESSALTRKIVCQDTGLSSSQIVDICGQIQKAKAKGQLPSSRSPFQTKSKALTGVYGRSNRIQKLVAQPNTVRPGFAHYSAPQPMVFPSQQQPTMQPTVQKPQTQVSVEPAPSKIEVQQVQEREISHQEPAVKPERSYQQQQPEESVTIIEQQQTILEMSEKQQEFQTLDNKVSQEYLHQKLNDVANNDNTIERQFTYRDNDQDDVLSQSDKSEESIQVPGQQVMNQPEKIVLTEQEDQNMIQELQPVQDSEVQNQRKQSIDSDDQLMMNALQYKASQEQIQAASGQKAQQEESSHEGDSYDPEIEQDIVMEQHDHQKPVEQNPQFAQNQQQAYSESKSEVQSDDDDESNSKVSEQRFRAQGPEHQQASPQAPQAHHSRPTFGVKQPVSHHIQDDYSESELDSEDNVPKPQNNITQGQNMLHQNPNQERYVSQSIQSSYSNEQSEEVRLQPPPQHQNFKELSEDEDDGLPSDSEFQNQMHEKKQQNHNLVSQSLWGQHNQAQAVPVSKQEDQHISENEDNSSSSDKSSDDEHNQPAQQAVPQAYHTAPQQQFTNQSFHQTDKNHQHTAQISAQIQEAQNEPQLSSVISPSKILQNIDNQNILNSYPNHMIYGSEIKNTFNHSNVQLEQPCTFEAGQMVTNHHHALHSLSANQNDHLNLTGEKYRDQQKHSFDETDKLTVDEFYPLIDPKIKNQIAAKVRLELQDEVKESVRQELTQTVTQEVQSLLKTKIEQETEMKVKQQVTLEITEKVAQETELRLKQKYELEQIEKHDYQMEQFAREKEEMALTMRKLQDIIQSKENEMQQHELENQQFVMTLNDKINKQNETMRELEDERLRQVEIKRQTEISRQAEEDRKANEAARIQREEALEQQRIAEAKAAEEARVRAELEHQIEMERQAEINRLNEIRRREEERAEQERIRAEQERIRFQQLELLKRANEEKAQQEAAAMEAQRVIEAQKQVELQRLLEAQKQAEIQHQLEALERQKAAEYEKHQQMLKAQEEERLAIEIERQNMQRIQQQEKEEQRRIAQQEEEEERLRKFEAESRRQKEEEDRQHSIKKREVQENLRQMQVQKAEQEKAILIQKQEQLKILMELKTQEEEQMKQRQKLEEHERMRQEKERLDKIRQEMNEQEDLRQQQIKKEEDDEMERKQKEIQQMINQQTIVIPKAADLNDSIEIVTINQMKSEDKLSELQEKQKQLDELKAIQKQLEEEKQKSKLAMIAQQTRNDEQFSKLAEEKRNSDEKIIRAQAEKLYQLEIQNAQLLEQNKNIKFSQLSAQKSNHSAYSQNGIPIINLEDDNDIDDSPSKQKYLSHAKEESSYLPDIVPQEQLVKKKEKIIKKVRFHDDDPVTVLPVDYQRVGTKRTLYKNAAYNTIEDEDDVDEQELMDEEECDEQFAKITQNLKAQKLEEQQVVNIQREDRQARNMRRKTYSEDAYIYSDNDDDDWDRRDKRVAHKRRSKQDGKQTASTSKSGQSPMSTTEHGSTSKFSASSPFKSTVSKEYDAKMSQHLKQIAPAAQKNPQLMKMLEKIAFKR